jgi:hypothetical protein
LTKHLQFGKLIQIMDKCGGMLMKKIVCLIIAVLVIFSSTAFAQEAGNPAYAVDKGSLIIGGNAGFASMGGAARNDETMTVITLNPSVLYFPIPNVAVGNAETFYGAGPELGYYFGDRFSKILPFVTLGYIYGKHQNEYTESLLRFSAGRIYLVAKNVGLSGELYYLVENYDVENSGSSVSGYTFGVALGIAAFVF